jgi:hypothetical protein
VKKFDDSIIYSVMTEPIVGGRMGDWIIQLMKNQNDIIDWIQKTHPVSFERSQK